MKKQNTPPLQSYWILWSIIFLSIGLIDQFIFTQKVWSDVDCGLILLSGALLYVWSITLWMRWSWALVTNIFAFWFFALLLFIVALLERPYSKFVAKLPAYFTFESWSSLLLIFLVFMTILAILGGYQLSQPAEWSRFGKIESKARPICSKCGVEKESNKPCPYCDNHSLVEFFLQPAWRGTKRVYIKFEQGIKTLEIGRAVPNTHVQIDETLPVFETISRHHANLFYDSRNNQLELEQGPTPANTKINGEALRGKREIKLGDVIELGQVTFVLGNSDFRPIVAEWYADGVPEEKKWLIFEPKKHLSRIIGQDSSKCAIELDQEGIAPQHLKIIYLPEQESFAFRNTSNQSIQIDGFELLPENSEIKSVSETEANPLVFTLAGHNFWFVPVPYRPK